MNQLNRLLLYIQPLRHSDGHCECTAFGNSSKVVRILFAQLAHQLNVIDVFMGKLLQGSSGRLLQWESDSLKCLVLAFHADLCRHLQGAAGTYT